MLTVSSKVLSLSAEAAVLVRAGRIVYANGAAEQLLGADADKMIPYTTSTDIGCLARTVPAKK